MSAKYSELAVSSFPGYFLSYFKWTFIQQIQIWLLMLKKLNLLPAHPPVLSGLGQLRCHGTGDPRLLSKLYHLPAHHSLLGTPTCPCSCHDDITCVDGVGVGQPGGGGEHSRPPAWLLSWDPLSRPQTGLTLPVLLVLWPLHSNWNQVTSFPESQLWTSAGEDSQPSRGAPASSCNKSLPIIVYVYPIGCFSGELLNHALL